MQKDYAALSSIAHLYMFVKLSDIQPDGSNVVVQDNTATGKEKMDEDNRGDPHNQGSEESDQGDKKLIELQMQNSTNM
ncbi:hypothetical protein GUJ93_ZPchr0008g13004 [Zizania palustris]|uniref:Uncharacterized protein n=1 Tax=Zizania palustris TaxID=103762 RepID=A0A8J5V584_ZIZPA|nr:hypothetical protein GUJ93_ZPchr0008g13004 [Zizania palustris]